MIRTSKLGHTLTHTLRATLVFALMLSAGAAHAEFTADVQAKVDKYKQKLVEWAKNPAVIAAVKEANAKGAANMTNAKWQDVDEKDAAVVAILNSATSSQIKSWEEDKNINKLYVRDKDGNLVAASNKPLLYNVASREPYKQGIQGKVWNAGEAKPDPTTQIKSVQISAPISDGGKVIGVIHSAISAE